MSTSLISLDNASKLPAHLQAFATEGGNEFGFSGSAFPVISIKGKVFTIVKAKERTLVTKPGGDGEPAASLEVVILNVGPKSGYAKTFYAEGYTEGNNAKPTCYSNDGVSPAADAVEKQGSKCALCPQNAAGSGASQQNPKAKACRASKMLAVAPAGQLNDPMLLRVPGGSVIGLSEYGDWLAKRGVKAAGVVTKIGFDYSVAHPALTFKALGGVTPEMAQDILPMLQSKIVKQICGEAVAKDEELAGETESIAQIESKPEAPKSEPVAAAPAAPKAAPKSAPKKAAKVVESDTVASAEVNAALDALDFDDE